MKGAPRTRGLFANTNRSHYISVEYADEPEKQFVVVGAQHPGRLSYWEEYRFDSAGNHISTGGFMDGETGKQAVFSVYRLHFGHFGGGPVQLAYGVFGLALTVVSATGSTSSLRAEIPRRAVESGVIFLRRSLQRVRVLHPRDEHFDHLPQLVRV